MLKVKIIAVDFDGTLCENKYPEIGNPNRELITYLRDEKKRGARIILWTCRDGEELESAVKWCELYGLKFDAVNENAIEAIEEFGGDTRKIFAHEYIDDRATDAGFKLPYSTGFKLPYSTDNLNYIGEAPGKNSETSFAEFLKTGGTL